MYKIFIVLLSLSISVSIFAKEKNKSSKNNSKTIAKHASEFKDKRDKQRYRLVKIGNLEWFGDNLNYKMDDSYCFDDDENQCMAYGRLYKWNAAKKACPEGFRLPTHADFENLWTEAGADFNAAYLLKTTYGWKGETNGNDTLRFSAMPAGNRFDDETYGNMNKFAFFWSNASEDNSNNAQVWFMTNKSMGFSYSSKPKIFGFSVRCVR